MKLILRNNKSQLLCHPKVLIQLRNHRDFGIRVPGAFFSPKFRKRQWDGKKYYISEQGFLDTGKVPNLIRVLDKMELKPDIVDERQTNVTPQPIPTTLGSKTAFTHQVQTVKAIVDNEVPDTLELPFPIQFHRGILKIATNGGKTMIAAMIHKTFGVKTLWLINSKELYNQALEEMPELLGPEVGNLDHKNIEWNSFMICMVKTMNNRMKANPKIKQFLTQYESVIVDECDAAINKTFQTALNNLHHCYIKIGMSGSAFEGSNRIKHEDMRAMFGDQIAQVTTEELLKKGISGQVVVKIWPGNDDPAVVDEEEAIIKNKQRNRRVIKRLITNVDKGRLPCLIMTKFHKHVSILYKKVKKQYPELKVAWVHHMHPDREGVVKAFKNGEIDILVGSYILKRGKNFPLMRYLCHAAGGLHPSIPIQILGRALRTHESKKVTYLDDFFDQGRPYKTHSNKRVKTYKSQKVMVKEEYKKYTIK